jgi:hypothetical protein
MHKNVATVAHDPVTSSLDQTIEQLRVANTQASETIHAVARGIEVAAEHAEKIGHAGICVSQNNFSRAVSHIHALSSANSMNDMIARQSDLLNENLGNYLRDMSNLSDVVFKSMSAVYEAVWSGAASADRPADDVGEPKRSQ